MSHNHLTWAVLLGRWVEFARGALALPAEGQAGKLRDSVADIIMLQAVWFALEHVGELDLAERAVGLDRAEILIEKHSGSLHQRWGQTPLPGAIAELIADAWFRLNQRKSGG
ncbi:MAG: hypothetical protein IT443_14105 [Phycisphaeraceae bacterium]|nr:hypothetical protein [Phycisphaeraceae bacterium]